MVLQMQCVKVCHLFMSSSPRGTSYYTHHRVLNRNPFCIFNVIFITFIIPFCEFRDSFSQWKACSNNGRAILRPFFSHYLPSVKRKLICRRTLRTGETPRSDPYVAVSPGGPFSYRSPGGHFRTHTHTHT